MGDNGAEDVVMAKGGEVNKRDRDERPMETKDDQAHPESADDSAAEDGTHDGKTEQGLEEQAEQVIPVMSNCSFCNFIPSFLL